MNKDRFKFRVWWEKEKRYRIDVKMHPAEHFCQKDFIVEQCTGLKDKNGNLIYENDRVGFYVYGQDEKWHAQQGTVIWYNSCWGIETSSRFIQFENELTIKNPKDIEIIGNTHEQNLEELRPADSDLVYRVKLPRKTTGKIEKLDLSTPNNKMLTDLERIEIKINELVDAVNKHADIIRQIGQWGSSKGEFLWCETLTKFEPDELKGE